MLKMITCGQFLLREVKVSGSVKIFECKNVDTSLAFNSVEKLTPLIITVSLELTLKYVGNAERCVRV